jgi:hypothetical protein
VDAYLGPGDVGHILSALSGGAAAGSAAGGPDDQADGGSGGGRAERGRARSFLEAGEVCVCVCVCVCVLQGQCLYLSLCLCVCLVWRTRRVLAFRPGSMMMAAIMSDKSADRNQQGHDVKGAEIHNVEEDIMWRTKRV